MKRRTDPHAEERRFADWQTDSLTDALRAEFGERPHAPVEDWARDWWRAGWTERGAELAPRVRPRTT